jgi:hypothetical protein
MPFKEMCQCPAGEILQVDESNLQELVRFRILGRSLCAPGGRVWGYMSFDCGSNCKCVGHLYVTPSSIAYAGRTERTGSAGQRQVNMLMWVLSLDGTTTVIDL